jgi:hypothetical protein
MIHVNAVLVYLQIPDDMTDTHADVLRGDGGPKSRQINPWNDQIRAAASAA